MWVCLIIVILRLVDLERQLIGREMIVYLAHGFRVRDVSRAGHMHDEKTRRSV